MNEKEEVKEENRTCEHCTDQEFCEFRNNEDVDGWCTRTGDRIAGVQ